jgi:putative addiction module killer protein
MSVEEQKVIIYKRIDGKRPFIEWSDSIKDKQAMQRVLARVARVRSGNFGDSKSVGAGVIELRIPYGPGYRVYFGRDGAFLVVLLCGGDKSSQSKDIENAKKYWSNYQERKEYEQR